MNASLLVVAIANIVGQAPAQPPLFAAYAKAMTFYNKAPDPGLGPKMLRELRPGFTSSWATGRS
jgi:hypothetical protein